jgi:hypothetical protein
MLCNDSTKIVDPIDYQLYDWSDWSRMMDQLRTGDITKCWVL